MTKSIDIAFKKFANDKAEKAGVIEFTAITEGDYNHTENVGLKWGVL
jgi:hypothetical protein